MSIYSKNFFKFRFYPANVILLPLSLINCLFFGMLKQVLVFNPKLSIEVLELKGLLILQLNFYSAKFNFQDIRCGFLAPYYLIGLKWVVFRVGKSICLKGFGTERLTENYTMSGTFLITRNGSSIKWPTQNYTRTPKVATKSTSRLQFYCG